jgi:diadenosine tetraphosphate (Ap4A) HIT family hydrolase
MNCPFCDIQKKFTSIYLEGVDVPEEKQFGAWIDYEEDSYNNILWYAILNGDQYVRGYTLVISGLHIVKITGNAIEESLKSLILGINRVSKNLMKKLKCETIHVLTLCEGVEHLHFHLIPRYKNETNSEDNPNNPDHGYSDDERDFYVKHYWKRDKERIDPKTKEKKFENIKDFQEKIDAGDHKIHGMWYTGFHEMNYKFINPKNTDEIEKRLHKLKELTELLRIPELKEPEYLSK